MEELQCPKCKYKGEEGWLLSNPVQCPRCYEENQEHIHPVITKQR